AAWPSARRQGAGRDRATAAAAHRCVVRWGARAMKIDDITAFALSFPVSGEVRLGIGRTVKRDTVLVRVRTAGGLVGWGEAHPGRAPGSIAHLVQTTLAPLVRGMQASDVVGVWERVYRLQLASHGMGAAAAMGLSGIDMALWDIRAKA